MICAVNVTYLLSTFSSCDPLVKTFILASHCFHCYGSCLWKLNSSRLKALEIAFNNVLRKVWRLPRRCHTAILHCVAGVTSMFNRVSQLSNQFVTKAVNHSSFLISCCFNEALLGCYNFAGYNSSFSTRHHKYYSDCDWVCAEYISDIRMGHLTFDSFVIRDYIVTAVCSD